MQTQWFATPLPFSFCTSLKCLSAVEKLTLGPNLKVFAIDPIAEVSNIFYSCREICYNM